MSLMRRLFSSAYRRARRAEGRGEYREAAALYAEADAPEEAANALLFAAARAEELDARLDAYRDALRWLPEDHPRVEEVEAQIGLAILDEAQRRGAHGADEKRRLEDAAARLERVGKPSEAATAYEILGRHEDMARCLQAAGDVERLEALLEETTEEARRERRLRRLIGDYEMAMAVGARIEARTALRDAIELAPEDRSVADLLRRLEGRFPPSRRLELRVDGRAVSFVGEDAVEVGRDADLVVRGASVSRRHTRLGREGDDLIVTDLDSRNGTLLRGVPVAGEVRVQGGTEIGLGDDVTLKVEPAGEGLRVTVVDGLDRDLVALVGRGELRLEGLAAALSFPGGHATITPDRGAAAELGRQKVAAPVVLLEGDQLTIDGVRVEVP
ncbi:MAG: hypothetical protein CMN31_10195 [Sandaracinus sp.]|nr:hypothetical protein [Sandaracinus sp.]